MARKRKKAGAAARFNQACERALASGKNNGFTRACAKRLGRRPK